MNILTEHSIKRKDKLFVNDSLDFNRRRRKIDFVRLKKGIIYVAEILLVVLLAYLVVLSFGIRYKNIGESMEPTIGANDTLIANCFIYKLASPRSGDIVIFSPKDSHSQHSVKRVIGVPGDKIQIKDGAIFVNDKILNENIKTEAIESGGLASNLITLGHDEYFLLGDNRNNSEDSRFESVGNVTKDRIIGKVWLDVSAGHFGTL